MTTEDVDDGVDDKGKLDYLLIISLEISERKKAEKELKTANDKLSQKKNELEKIKNEEK